MNAPAFNEGNSVRDFVRDTIGGWAVQMIHGPNLDRTIDQVLLESRLREALIRLNPEIEEEPSRADEVIHRLRAIVLSAHTSGLVPANEEFAAWLKGDRSMPFGAGGSHTTVRLINFDDPAPDANDWIQSTEVTFRQGKVARRFDLVLWCNGIPLVVGEAKTPLRPAISWLDGAVQVNDDYVVNVRQFFVPNVLVYATEGKDLRYGSVGMPANMWGPWRNEGGTALGLQRVGEAALGVSSPASVLDFLRWFTLYATDAKHRKIKVVARYQQVQAARAILHRVLTGEDKKGLIWHFQGSGKSLLMVFAAQMLRVAPELASPTVLIVVDRIDLDTQITGTFSAADVPNLVSTESRAELQQLLLDGARKVIITTVHKFAEAPGVLDERANIIALVDEAHRSQEGDYGRKMREALPNAFLFGMTGTPINQVDRNTFWAFGSDKDAGGYLSKYSFQDSIRDGATLRLHFEPRLSEISLDEAGLDAAFDAMVERGALTDRQRSNLSQKAASIEYLIKSPERVQKVSADIAQHFREKVEPSGFKAQVVVYDKAACVAYKDALDVHLGPEASAVVMSMSRDDPQDWKERFALDRDAEAKLLDRFRDPADPLKILIVTAKLLTGFDAPILQTQYLDKPLRNHTLLQAICRTNRTYAGKTHGLIVDYLGIFDDIARSLAFDEEVVKTVITNIAELAAQLPAAVAAAISFFNGVDRTVGGWEGLLAAQNRLPDEPTKDAFGAAYSIVAQLWEALSPDPLLHAHLADFQWLTAVYQSIKPVDHTGRLVWHALGAKTLDIINEHIAVEVPRSDLETIVLDADVIEDLSKDPDPTWKPQDIVKIITARLARHGNDPVFVALSERLQELRDRYAAGQLESLEFLRSLLAVARDTLQAERDAQLIPREERGRAALTELFESVRSEATPIIVSRVVADIDEVVTVVRFPGWQTTASGDRDVRQALRKILWLTYQMRDEDVYQKAYQYIREYY
ncbi:type I restriction endonuclease subunit R [Microbacterium sp. ProA8]|uniref:type I restriction endonuclease subunit R n=1 Tax=Microbacterium chionoecetis TaxID=3153754 RepID=UPI0032633B17